MSDRVLYLIIIVSYVIFAGIAIFAIWPERERRFNRAKLAARISKYFGDTKIRIFQFDETGEQGEKRYVFAVLEYDGWNPKELTEISRHFRLMDIEATEKEYRKAITEIELLQNLLPYDVKRERASMTYTAYKEAVHTMDGSCL